MEKTMPEDNGKTSSQFEESEKLSPLETIAAAGSEHTAAGYRGEKKVEKKKDYDYEILFLQTIGILAVVNGHYKAVNATVNSFFPYYSWHMPFFIFLSGILFARTYQNRTLIQYFLHKCKTLLIPALFVNLCYGIIYYFLKRYHLVTYGSKISYKSFFVTPFTNNGQFGINISLWFILQLFIIEILINVLYRIPRQTEKKFDGFLSLIFFAISVYSFYVAKYNRKMFGTYYLLFRTGYLTIFFIFGMIYEKYLREKLINFDKPVLGCFLSITIQSLTLMIIDWPCTYNTRTMTISENMPLLFPYFTFLTAAVFLVCLARCLAPVINNSGFLRFVGTNNRYIVYHHQFCGIMLGLFALIPAAAGRSDLVPNFSFADFRADKWYSFSIGANTNGLGKLPYLVIPLFVPVLIGTFINRCKNKMIRFLLWCGLLFLVLGFIILLGRGQQEYIRLF